MATPNSLEKDCESFKRQYPMEYAHIFEQGRAAGRVESATTPNSGSGSDAAAREAGAKAERERIQGICSLRSMSAEIAEHCDSVMFDPKQTKGTVSLYLCDKGLTEGTEDAFVAAGEKIAAERRGK